MGVRRTGPAALIGPRRAGPAARAGRRAVLSVAIAGVALAACSAPAEPGAGRDTGATGSVVSPATPGTPASSSPPAAAVAPVATLLAAGDIASCGSTGDEATAAVLDRAPGTIATLGDNVYQSGSIDEFERCYAPTWGRHRDRTRPAPGNHDYQTLGARGYFAYFGAAAGPLGKGYYSYDLGAWHAVVVNSNCAAVGGCHAGSAQERWLRADLARSGRRCTLAYWHHPPFTSGAPHSNATWLRPIFQTLYDAGVEVALAGHNHQYERFAPQTPAGRADPARGVRMFVVGTGGASHYRFGAVQPNSEVRDSTTYGVLRLTLHPDRYDWRFLPAGSGRFTDAGSYRCH
ncbi:MAG TPA: metallophosphoesterase [Pilimelia sp.]|nr:metallophosphoesterase [Pilimelia sp.]